MHIDGSHPLVKKLELGTVLLVILAFDFEYQGGAIRQADKVNQAKYEQDRLEK